MMEGLDEGRVANVQYIRVATINCALLSVKGGKAVGRFFASTRSELIAPPEVTWTTTGERAYNFTRWN